MWRQYQPRNAENGDLNAARARRGHNQHSVENLGSTPVVATLLAIGENSRCLEIDGIVAVRTGKTIIGILCFVLQSTGSTAYAESTVIFNVNVLPMTSETVLRAKTVIVTDGKITSIGEVRQTPIPEGVNVIDGTDRYLMPGLSEMHAHVPDADSDSLQRVLNLYVANGVTLLRGMLGEPSQLRLRQQILDGEVLGPRLVTSGPSFNGRSVHSPQQAEQMVIDQHALGYDFIKIHPGLELDEFDALARMANKLGIPFAGHVPVDVGVAHALAAGIATIDHLDGYMQTLIPAHEDPSGGFGGFFGVLLAEQADEAKIDGIVAATRRAGAWNVPTQSLFVNVVSGDDAQDMIEWPEMRYVPAQTVRQWADSKQNVVERIPAGIGKSCNPHSAVDHQETATKWCGPSVGLGLAANIQRAGIFHSPRTSKPG